MLAIGIVGHELFKIWMRLTLYEQTLAEALPLHLCNAAAFLVAYVLARRSYSAFEIAYFWALTGTVQAILTPDLPSGYPSLPYLTFFLSHGLVIMGVFYAIVVYGFRPTLSSVGKAIVVTLAYAALIAPVNVLLGTNYLYLRHKPAGASLIDYLGPWPWYIAALVGIGIGLILLCYAPFAVLARYSQTRDPIAD